MPNFAIIKDEIVLNTIVADSKAIAEEVTGETCIEFTIEKAEPNGTYTNGIFIKAKPYPSWITDGNNGWQAPINYPAFNEENPKFYIWDESKINWVETTN